MTSVPYIILLNRKLKHHILSLNDTPKRRIHEKFEYLENGLWEGGVRVKN